MNFSFSVFLSSFHLFLFFPSESIGRKEEVDVSAIPPLPLSSQIRTAVTPFLRENNLCNWVLVCFGMEVDRWRSWREWEPRRFHTTDQGLKTGFSFSDTTPHPPLRGCCGPLCVAAAAAAAARGFPIRPRRHLSA